VNDVRAVPAAEVLAGAAATTAAGEVFFGEPPPPHPAPMKAARVAIVMKVLRKCHSRVSLRRTPATATLNLGALVKSLALGSVPTA
jgi:hypothetical protein